MRAPTTLFLAATVLLLSTACFGPEKRNPVPREATRSAVFPGLPGARFWADEPPTFQTERFEAWTDDDLRRIFGSTYGVPHHYLAISGGGANGAFGAGLLAGWTAAGTRPEFTMVTGVSTGALTAPFAFLGPDWDDTLKTIYTTTTTDQLLEERGLFGKLFGESVMKTDRLREVIEDTYDAELLDAIAAEGARGRRLYIGTVNLDAGRPVIWNITEIAASDVPGKLDLFHDILLASASIPVAFPPVMIDVEVDGVAYDEMHVDGGTAAQVFVYPASVDWPLILRRLQVPEPAHVYVVRNAFLDADFQGVNRSLFPIAGRSIDSLIRTQGIGDLYQIFTLCQRDATEFNLAYIPATFTEEPAEMFDPVYMTALYEMGYEMATQEGGYPWEATPPDYGSLTTDP